EGAYTQHQQEDDQQVDVRIGTHNDSSSFVFDSGLRWMSRASIPGGQTQSRSGGEFGGCGLVVFSLPSEAGRGSDRSAQVGSAPGSCRSQLKWSGRPIDLSPQFA